MDTDNLKKLIQDFANEYPAEEEQRALYDALQKKFDRRIMDKLKDIFNDPKPWLCSIIASYAVKLITSDQILSALIGVPAGVAVSSLYEKISEASSGKKIDFIKLLDVNVKSSDAFNNEDAELLVRDIQNEIPRFSFLDLLKEGLSQGNLPPV